MFNPNHHYRGEVRIHQQIATETVIEDVRDHLVEKMRQVVPRELRKNVVMCVEWTYSARYLGGTVIENVPQDCRVSWSYSPEPLGMDHLSENVRI